MDHLWAIEVTPMAELALTRRFADGRMRKELRACRDTHRRRRLDILRLVKQGYGPTEIGRILDCSRTTVRTVVLAFNERGWDGLLDERARNGRAPKLTAEQTAALLKALEDPPPDGGLWSGPKVRAWLKTMFDIESGPRYGWQTLRRLNFTLQQPQTRHGRADAARQDEFKKSLSRSWTRSGAASPAPSSRSGPRTRPASASSQSSVAAGALAAADPSLSNVRASSGSTSTAS